MNSRSADSPHPSKTHRREPERREGEARRECAGTEQAVAVGRSRHGRWGGYSTVLAWTVIMAAAVTVGAATAWAEDPDPNFQAVQVVCGGCHGPEVFLGKPRSWARWNDVFADMTQRGANGTNDQLAGVTAYFLENLTLVNVNSSPADEIAWVLDVRDDVAQAIIERRQREPFENITQLGAVPGVDPAKLEHRKSRILF